ncbi:MAG TPA: hypothetical protein PLK49_01300 [Candidatus Dojkabacteria bacterium]|jgi:phenylalanine-4-hydroxylase|nr:hypothetical protein [Candidatus Dojkabacteria bacterium]
MENKKITQENLEKFSNLIHEQLYVERKISFGEFMTIIEALGLPEKQYNAVKQIIAKKIDDRIFFILNMFDMQIKQELGYESNESKCVEVLA